MTDLLKPRRLPAVRIGLFLLLAVVGALAALWPKGAVQAAPAPEVVTAAADNPKARKVVVGIYVNQVKKLSMVDNEFTVDFWIWFRWKGEDYDPLKSFEVIGGSVDSTTGEQRKNIGDELYASVRITATIKKFFDVRKFPLDDHEITIEVEETQNEDHLVQFVADATNSMADPAVEVPGWSIGDSSAQALTHSYKTNYGDTSLPSGNESRYTRFVFGLKLVRPGLSYLFKLFWSIYLAVVIGFLALLIKPTDLDPRFGLGVGAIFAAAASSFVVSAALPPTSVFTLSDKVNMIAVGFIFVSLMESIFSLRFIYKEKPASSVKLDRICFWGLMAAYALANYIAVATA